jgi:hypothetical protein
LGIRYVTNAFDISASQIISSFSRHWKLVGKFPPVSRIHGLSLCDLPDVRPKIKSQISETCSPYETAVFQDYKFDLFQNMDKIE